MPERVHKIALLKGGLVAKGAEAARMYEDVRFLHEVMEAGYSLRWHSSRLYLTPASKSAYVTLKAGEAAALAVHVGMDMAMKLLHAKAGRSPTLCRRLLAKGLGGLSEPPTADELDRLTIDQLLLRCGVDGSALTPRLKSDIANLARTVLQRGPVEVSPVIYELAVEAYRELMEVGDEAST